MRLGIRVVLLTFALLGCEGDGGNEPDNPRVEGRWSGSFMDGGVAYSLTLTLTENNGEVSGSGDAVVLHAEGTYVPPTVSLAITAPGFENLMFTGTVEEGVIRGRLDGSGFLNTLVVLDRQ